jgi:hypothetical protein
VSFHPFSHKSNLRNKHLINEELVKKSNIKDDNIDFEKSVVQYHVNLGCNKFKWEEISYYEFFKCDCLFVNKKICSCPLKKVLLCDCAYKEKRTCDICPYKEEKICACLCKRVKVHKLANCYRYKRQQYKKLLRGELINTNRKNSKMYHKKMVQHLKPNYLIFFWIKRLR